MIGLNVGSGQRPFRSTSGIRWINVDSQEKWSPEIVGDGRKIPLDDNSVDYFVLHHVLEHFGCDEGDGLIKEAHRLLKPRGSLLVFVPDMKEIKKRWVAGEIDNFIFFVNCYGAYMGSEDDRHKWGYTHDSLHMTLYNAANWYSDRRIYSYSIPGSDIAWDWWILAMEAIK